MHTPAGAAASLVAAGSAIALLLLAPSLTPAQEVTIRFEGSGPENGITEPGARDFSFMGSSWSGGVVRTEGIFALYSSGHFSYEVGGGGAIALFVPPVSRTRFFYVHGFGFPSGTATAFAPDGRILATASSRSATSFGDPANFVVLESEEPIARIDFSAGVIDDFTFLAAAPATATPTLTQTSSPSTTTTPTPSPSPSLTATPPGTATPSPTATVTPTATLTPIPCGGDCGTRGDLNCDESIDATDVDLLLAALFSESFRECENHDVNSDGRLSAADIVLLLVRVASGETAS